PRSKRVGTLVSKSHRVVLRLGSDVIRAAFVSSAFNSPPESIVKRYRLQNVVVEIIQIAGYGDGSTNIVIGVSGLLPGCRSSVGSYHLLQTKQRVVVRERRLLAVGVDG